MSYSIVVKHVGKAYRSGQSRRERFKEWFIPFYTSQIEPTWVLRDINFSVRPGESIGIVGMNGAGKSTLLKIITGTTSPTTGNVTFHGRVAALLELGMGFHPDFTGRQNIALAGQLIGLSAKELAGHMAEIENFAEIGTAIDDPVRTYSSGMQMRLAFSLATAVRPDILIVDEALSVGDAYFQQKSFGKIRAFREQGTTLLFVSHDKSAVLQLCDRAILLNKGQALFDGTPAETMDMYNALLAEKQNTVATIVQEKIEDRKLRISSGNKHIEILATHLVDKQGTPLECVATGQPVRLEIDFIAHEDVSEAVFGLLLKERTGMEVFGTNTFHLKKTIDLRRNTRGSISFSFRAWLGPGMYSITVGSHQGGSHVQNNFHWIDLAVTFTVVNLDYPVFAGITRFACQADIYKE